MDQRSVFFDDWLNSLREQYKYVIRQDDQVALPSLTTVMLEAGFDEGDLVALRAEVGVPAAETVTAPETDNETVTEVEPPAPTSESPAADAKATAPVVAEPDADIPDAADDAPLTFDEGIALSVADESDELDEAIDAENIDPAEESAQMSMF